MRKPALLSLLFAVVLSLVSASAQEADFFTLASSGTVQSVNDAILNGANYNARDSLDRTPLMSAAADNSDPAVTKALIEAGADIEARDSNGVTPLMYAAANNPSLPVTSALLKAKASIKVSDSSGMTALLYAAALNKNTDVFTTLLKAGAAFKVQDINGATPLMHAAASNLNPAIIAILLKAGATVKETDRTGMTPLLYAASFNRNPGMFSALLKAGAVFKVQDVNGATPLMHAAATNPSLAAIQAVLKAGGDLKAQDKWGATPLMYAAKSSSNPDVIAALLKAGANINARDRMGATPLMYATGSNQNGEVISALIDAGASSTAKDNAGNNAVDYAKKNPGWTSLSPASDEYKKLKKATQGFFSLITTVAGNGDEGYSGDGCPATSASFVLLRGIAVDKAGKVYIAESGIEGERSRVRRVDPSGTITTVAGNGKYGDSGDGGPATSASFVLVRGVATDLMGNLYIVDRGANRVRKVDLNGKITTVAGNGDEGYSGDGGLATSASLNVPWAIAVDSVGDIYVAERGKPRIRRIDIDGVVTTVAGNGSEGYSGDGGLATSASFSDLMAVAIDAKGNIYVADMGNSRIRKIDTSGIVTTLAGSGNKGYSGDGGPATSASLSSPTGVAVDAAGSIYIADNGNSRIRKVDATGVITTVAGNGEQDYSGDGGPAPSASLSSPGEVAVDVAGGVYIADWHNQRVRLIR
jgi:ankyrin repeat protein/sugar lactone lactonase YvrE